MKRFLTLAMILAGSVLYGQDNKAVKFTQIVHDFGELKEEAGNADFSFTFKNAGTVPLKLTDVKASCGCTTPSWTNEEVKPGGDGSIKASYSTMNRPGPFTKTITVKAMPTGGAEEVHVLTIKGNVIPRPKGPKDFYPAQMGKLRATTNHIAFGKVNHDAAINTQRMVIYNESTTPISINKFEAPAHITFKNDKSKILPNDSTVVTVTYDATKLDDWGFIHTQAKMFTTDTSQAEKVIYVSAERVEHFKEMTEAEKANAPKIAFETETFDFGTIKAGAKVENSFKFTNSGKSELVIRKTKASCGCTAISPEKTKLKPGESSVIKFVYDSTNKKGNESKTITVITNDPIGHTKTLTIKGVVEEVPATPK